MQKGHYLEFQCLECQSPIIFSLFLLDKNDGHVECKECHRKYAFSDETLIRQIKKFEALCIQIKESEEILSCTSLGLDFEDKKIRIPYRLLLTRLHSSLDLMVGDRPVSIHFRLEPVEDICSVIAEGEKR